jgi:hypothetical protein
MSNPNVPDLVKKRFKAEAKQGGTCPEGTNQSPQKGASAPPSGTRSEGK